MFIMPKIDGFSLIYDGKWRFGLSISRNQRPVRRQANVRDSYRLNAFDDILRSVIDMRTLDYSIRSGYQLRGFQSSWGASKWPLAGMLAALTCVPVIAETSV